MLELRVYKEDYFSGLILHATLHFNESELNKIIIEKEAYEKEGYICEIWGRLA